MRLGTVVFYVFVGFWLAGCYLSYRDSIIVKNIYKYISEGGDVPSLDGMTVSGETSFVKELVDILNRYNMSVAERTRTLVIINIINARREARGIHGYAIRY